MLTGKSKNNFYEVKVSKLLLKEIKYNVRQRKGEVRTNIGRREVFVVFFGKKNYYETCKN